MPLMNWTDKLSVGVAALDEDYKKLVGMLNELFDGVQAGRGKDQVGKTLDGLVNYTKVHFAREEKFFATTGYAASSAHKKEHDELTKQVIEVQQKYQGGATTTLSWG